jgi:hypothetical protein
LGGHRDQSERIGAAFGANREYLSGTVVDREGPKGRYVTLFAMSELVTIKPPRTAVSVSGSVVIPAAIADAGEHAVRRFLEFFAATIRNRNTREARSSPGSNSMTSASWRTSSRCTSPYI